MKTISAHTDPVAGSLRAADANPALWALAVRWGSRIDGEGDTYAAAAAPRCASLLVPAQSES
jgi:hypothetical protein